jgi:hypothetical protein
LPDGVRGHRYPLEPDGSGGSVDKMKSVPVDLAMKLREEGCAWRDVAEEIAWTTGRRFAPDAVAAACRRRRARDGAV